MLYYIILWIFIRRRLWPNPGQNPIRSPRGGCAGFLYEREMGTTAYYDYVELVENWKIFYRIPRK